MLFPIPDTSRFATEPTLTATLGLVAVPVIVPGISISPF